MKARSLFLIVATLTSVRGASAQMLGALLVSTSVGAGLVNATGISITTNQTSVTSLYASGNVGIGTTSPGQKLTVSGTIESTSGGVKFPDGNTQAVAFQRTITVRTNNVSGFTLPNGFSTSYTASCDGDEVATGGGCSDGGFKMLYRWQPTTGGYICGWYNNSRASVTINGAVVYVACLK